MPDLGLLLDVDGPIASPVTRSIAIPSIADDLVTLAGAGVPIAFITGRSDAFVAEQVVAPLLARGLADALRRPGARMFGVFEKGGVSAPITPDGLGPIDVDASVVPPSELVGAVRGILSRYLDTMFFDETKRAMISIEQRTDVSAEFYAQAQRRIDAELAELVSPPWVLETSIIASDVQSERLRKDIAAGRALGWFRKHGPLPRRWRSVGDSRSDYLMADHLLAAGFDVAHVDVRPSDGVLEKPYPVVVEPGVIHDEAGAVFLRHWVRELGL